MYDISEFVKVKTAAEAYYLMQEKRAVVLGGMHWLKMQKKNIPLAIDISEIGLNEITESDDGFVIGAAVTLRMLETHEGLNQYAHNAFLEAVKGIVGVQFKNTATLGGCVALRSGFSDICTLLLALDARLAFYGAGDIGMKEYLEGDRCKDLLLSVTIPKKTQAVCFKNVRLNATDFSVVNVAAAIEDDCLRVVVGARPSVAKLVTRPLHEVKNMDADGLKHYVKEIASDFDFASNMRGSKEYRERLAKVLILQAISEITVE